MGFFEEFEFSKFLIYCTFLTVVENTATYPQELIRTRLQVNVNPTNVFSSYKNEIVNIYKSYGIGGFYRSMGLHTAIQIPVQSIYYFVYEYSKQYLETQFIKTDKRRDLNYSELIITENKNIKYRSDNTLFSKQCMAPAIAGMIAEMISMALCVPQDVIVQRLQIEKLNPEPVFSQFTRISKDILKNEGLFGFYKGSCVSFLTSVNESGVWWLVYEMALKITKNLRKRFKTKDEELVLLKNEFSNIKKYNNDLQVAKLQKPYLENDIGLYALHDHQVTIVVDKMNETEFDRSISMETFISGTMAGTICALLSNPLQVVKTRIQTNLALYSQKHWWQIMGSTVRNEGFKSLFKGILAKIILSAPCSVLSAICYECLILWSRKERALDNSI